MQPGDYLLVEDTHPKVPTREAQGKDYCNRSQMTSQRVKNKKSTTRDEVEWRDCCSLHAVASSVIYCTHTQKNGIYLFYTIKIKMVY